AADGDDSLPPAAVVGAAAQEQLPRLHLIAGRGAVLVLPDRLVVGGRGHGSHLEETGPARRAARTRSARTAGGVGPFPAGYPGPGRGSATGRAREALRQVAVLHGPVPQLDLRPRLPADLRVLRAHPVEVALRGLVLHAHLPRHALQR